jgi:hypothetical protein
VDIFRIPGGVVECTITVGEIKMNAAALPMARKQIAKELALLKWAAAIAKSASVFHLIGRIFLDKSAGKKIKSEQYHVDGISYYIHLI